MLPLVLLAWLLILSSAQLDPAEYFKGSLARPKLEIIHPENGQVLSGGVLDIKIKILGYELPSHFDDSSICIGLSNRATEVGEQCFDRTTDLDFHVNGLSPGETYSLRVLFRERGKTIAMSIRSFRVAGIIGVLDAPVTIETALEVAVKHQLAGLYLEAERIYRNILSEHPSHQHAMHLLGTVFHLKGEHSAAIPYMEQALQWNNSVDHFHNNLGECYRVLGRIDDAMAEFHKALELNPYMFHATLNIGLIYQKSFRQLMRALKEYRKLQMMEVNQPGLIPPDTQLEVKIRECDLVEALAMSGGFPPGEAEDELECWLEGYRLFPESRVITNELGNTYVERGLHKQAFEMYTIAASLGLFIAELNKANVLELQGFAAEAMASFQETLIKAEAENLPSFHVMVRMTTVVHRIMPSTDYEIRDLRDAMERELDRLLSSPAPRNIDNAPPTNYGFSTGYFLAFQGHNDASIKAKIYRLYLLYCPALQNGYFVDPTSGEPMDSAEEAVEDEGEARALVPSTAPSSWTVALASVDDAGGMERTSWGGEEGQLFDGTSEESISALVESDSTSPSTTAIPPDAARTSTAATAMQSMSAEGARMLRVGVASRHLYSHQVGYLFEGVISELGRAGYIIEVFLIDGYAHNRSDDVYARIDDNVHTIHPVTAELTTVIRAIREAKVDILVYPDLGLDPIPFFAAFSRLAPIQVTGLGHVDTSGLDTIDYYVSDSNEIPSPGSDSHYTETLVRMRGMGTCFIDRYLEYASALQAPRTALLERAKYIEGIGLPRAAHVYVVAQPLFAIHPSFDEVITRILLHDKLAYIVFLDPTGKASWQHLFRNRLGGKFSEETSQRIFFHSQLSQAEALKAIAAAHAVLDPFPAAADISGSFFAVALGVPVITFPAQRMIGRLTLGLYKRLGYTDLVVSSPAEYTTLALTLAHKPKVRQAHSDHIMALRQRLFDCSEVVGEWSRFFRLALESSPDLRIRNANILLPVE